MLFTTAFLESPRVFPRSYLTPFWRIFNLELLNPEANSLYLSVATFPENREDNPYLTLVKNAMSQVGVKYFEGNGDYLSFAWLWAHRKEVKVIHLHWLQYHYVTNSNKTSLSKVSRFLLKLIFARLIGYHIVWTMHNIMPHDPSSPEYFDNLVRNWVVRIANAIIVHCEYAKDLLARRYHRTRGVFVAPHPFYSSPLPVPMNKKDAREILGWSDSNQVLLFFGSVRPYKGVGELITAFQHHQSDSQELVIVGRPRSEAEKDHLLELIAENPKIKTRFEYVSDLELAVYIRACDVVVLPFREVLNSGSAMLAISLGRPVIAPSAGCLPEIFTPDCSLLYNPSDPEGLSKALDQIEKLDLIAMSQNAFDRVNLFSTDLVAEPTLRAYRAFQRNSSLVA